MGAGHASKIFVLDQRSRNMGRLDFGFGDNSRGRISSFENRPLSNNRSWAQFGNVELAASLVGAAEAERVRAGGGWGPDTVGAFDVKAKLAERFDEKRIEELIAPGRLLDLAEAVEMALSETKD